MLSLTSSIKFVCFIDLNIAWRLTFCLMMDLLKSAGRKILAERFTWPWRQQQCKGTQGTATSLQRGGTCLCLAFCALESIPGLWLWLVDEFNTDYSQGFCVFLPLCLWMLQLKQSFSPQSLTLNLSKQTWPFLLCATMIKFTLFLSMPLPGLKLFLLRGWISLLAIGSLAGGKRVAKDSAPADR